MASAFISPMRSMDTNDLIANSKARLGQGLLITDQVYSIQRLYDMGLTHLVPRAIKMLHMQVANYYDDKYLNNLFIIQKKIKKEAIQKFNLKPSDYKIRSIKYYEMLNYIKNRYYDRMFQEIMKLFQRRNIVAAKSMIDVDVNLELGNISDDEARKLDIG
jgi:hypothetical protein